MEIEKTLGLFQYLRVLHIFWLHTSLAHFISCFKLSNSILRREIIFVYSLRGWNNYTQDEEKKRNVNLSRN